jgi:hypothetical protein
MARSALAKNQYGAIRIGNQFDLASDEVDGWALFAPIKDKGYLFPKQYKSRIKSVAGSSFPDCVF